MPAPFLMPPPIGPFLQHCTVTLPPLYHKSGSIGYFGMDKFAPLSHPLDTLDSLSVDRGAPQSRSRLRPGVLICANSTSLLTSGYAAGPFVTQVTL